MTSNVRPIRRRINLEGLEEYLLSLADKLPWYLSFLGPLLRLLGQASRSREYCLILIRACGAIPLPLGERGYSEMPIESIYIDLPVEIIRPQVSEEPFEGIEDMHHSHRARLVYAAEFDRGLRDGADTLRLNGLVESIATRLGPGKRLVVLGDPGSGKTTLLNWVTVQYALRAAHRACPETGPWAAPLPDHDWMPFLIHCRNLTSTDLDSPIEEILAALFRPLQRGKAWVERMVEKALDSLRQGRALLLVDGLDEIPSVEARQRFCTQLTNLSRAYPDVPMLITSRIVGYDAVGKPFGRDFEVLVMAGLRPEDKARFAQRWAAATSGPREAATRAEELRALFGGSRGISRLTENILMLALVAQLHSSEAPLPARRVDLYRRAVISLIERRREDGEDLTANEALPQLEHLAYRMRRQGAQKMTGSEIVQIFAESRELEPVLQETRRHSPEQFFNLIVDRAGLLSKAGKEIDAQGLEQQVFQFVHQTFQEFLSGQAIRHGRSLPGETQGTSLRNRLRELLNNLQIEERTVDLSWRRAKEQVFAEQWQESIRMCIADVAPSEADEVLLDLLQPSHGAAPGEARARAVFAAACLADEPKVSSQAAEAIIDTFVESIEAADGVNNTRNTSLDESAYALSQSIWGARLQERLLETYMDSRGNRRMHAGCVLASLLQPAEGEQFTLDEVQPVLANLSTRDPRLRVVGIMRLLNRAYLRNGMFTEEEWPALRQLADALLSRLGDIESVATASAWALSWLTGAKNISLSFLLSPSQAERLLYFINSSDADPNALWWTCLCASRVEGMRESENWGLKWAHVADGNTPWRDLSRPQLVEAPLITSTLVALLARSPHPFSAEGAILALGRMGVYCQEYLSALFRIALNPLFMEETRSEALTYMVHTGGVEAGDILLNIFEVLPEEDSALKRHTYLALLGLGRIEILERMVREGNDQKGEVGERFAPAYVLAGHSDRDAWNILRALAAEEDAGISKAAQEALTMPWAEGKKPAPASS